MTSDADRTIDPTWYESHDNLVLVARYMADSGHAADVLAHFIEKPWHYEYEYRAALEQQAEENGEVAS
jgi:hypothetical protein